MNIIFGIIAVVFAIVGIAVLYVFGFKEGNSKLQIFLWRIVAVGIILAGVGIYMLGDAAKIPAAGKALTQMYNDGISYSEFTDENNYQLLTVMNVIRNGKSDKVHDYMPVIINYEIEMLIFNNYQGSREQVVNHVRENLESYGVDTSAYEEYLK